MERFGNILDRMEATSSSFGFLKDIESLADWAEELKPIVSTSLTGYRRTLHSFDARLSSLSEVGLDIGQKTTPVRKSLRVSQRPSRTDQEEPPSSGSVLRPGEIFINAVKCDRCAARNTVCEQAAGRSTRCQVCKDARQACTYRDAQSSGGIVEKVGPVLDAAEESEEETNAREVEIADEGEQSKTKSSPIVSALKKITSPLKKLGKRKPAELSPKAIEERESESSERAHSRFTAQRQSPELGGLFGSSSSLPSSNMPPPSSVPTTPGFAGREVYGASRQTDFYTRRLEVDLQSSQDYVNLLVRRLRESQEDLQSVLAAHESRESLLLEEVQYLRGITGGTQSQLSIRPHSGTRLQSG